MSTISQVYYRLSKSGKIIPIFEERLRNVGNWLKINSEAIYDSKYWKHQNDSLNGEMVWYTQVKVNKEIFRT